MTLDKFRKNKASYFSTIMGYVIAISEAYMLIDWANFDIKKEWPKLLFAGLIALGGHMTSINIIKNKR